MASNSAYRLEEDLKGGVRKGRGSKEGRGIGVEGGNKMGMRESLGLGDWAR